VILMSGQMYKVYLMPVLLGIVLLSACGDGANRSEVYEPVSYAVGDTVDVEGSLIDSQCFTMNKANSGMDHPHPVPTSQTGPACARYCAINGIPVAIALDSPNADVWMLLSNPQVLADYMGQHVKVRAIVRSRGVFIPERVEARLSDGSWTFVM